MKVDYANSLCPAGTMAWAIDLDISGESAFNLQDGGLDDNVTISAQFVEKTTAMNTQSNVQANVFWSRCLDDSAPDRHCPPGFHEIVTGHGKVFDAEHADLAPGCHGNQNRVLCTNNLIIEIKCAWNRNSNGILNELPVELLWFENVQKLTSVIASFLKTLTQLETTDCDHGKFISICCDGFTLAANTCPPTNFGALFSAGTAGSSAVSIDTTLFKRSLEDAISYESMNSTIDNSETQAEVETGKDHPKKTKRSSGSGGGCNNFYYPLNTGPNIIPVGIGNLGNVIYDPQGGSGGGEWQGIPGEVIVNSLPPFHTTVYSTQQRVCDGLYYLQYEEPRTITTLKALVMPWANMPSDASDPAYLTLNPCWPQVMPYRLNDPAYALLTQDAYYARTAYYIDPAIYEDAPRSVYTQGLSPPTRRDLSQMPNFDKDHGVIVVREINSTRLPTPEEMEKYLGYAKCSSEDCHEDIAEIRSQFEN